MQGALTTMIKFLYLCACFSFHPRMLQILWYFKTITNFFISAIIYAYVYQKHNRIMNKIKIYMWIDSVSQQLRESRRLFIYSAYTYECKHNLFTKIWVGDYLRANLQNNTFLSLYHKNSTQKLKWPK